MVAALPLALLGPLAVLLAVALRPSPASGGAPARLGHGSRDLLVAD